MPSLVPLFHCMVPAQLDSAHFKVDSFLLETDLLVAGNSCNTSHDCIMSEVFDLQWQLLPLDFTFTTVRGGARNTSPAVVYLTF